MDCFSLYWWLIILHPEITRGVKKNIVPRFCPCPIKSERRFHVGVLKNSLGVSNVAMFQNHQDIQSITAFISI